MLSRTERPRCLLRSPESLIPASGRLAVTECPKTQSKVLLTALLRSLSSWPRAQQEESVCYSAFLLPGRHRVRADTDTCNPCSGPRTGTESTTDGGGTGLGRIGALQTDSHVLVYDTPVAPWHPYDFPMLRLPPLKLVCLRNLPQAAVAPQPQGRLRPSRRRGDGLSDNFNIFKLRLLHFQKSD